MEGMQRYRLRTSPCDTADMTQSTISTLFPIRKKSHFAPLHSPDSSDSLIFFPRFQVQLEGTRGKAPLPGGRRLPPNRLDLWRWARHDTWVAMSRLILLFALS